MTAGTEALRDGLYYQASKALEQAISADGNFALAHARYSEALMELDNVDRAQGRIAARRRAGPRPHGALAELDALYLDAVTATVRRDFAAALSEPTARSRASRPTSRRSTLTSAAPTRTTSEPKKAVESYVRATGLDQQYATAYLRAGVLYGRQRRRRARRRPSTGPSRFTRRWARSKGARKSLTSARALYIRCGHDRGGAPAVQQALDLASAINNQPLQIKTMLQLAYVLHHQGETARAERFVAEGVESGAGQ